MRAWLRRLGFAAVAAAVLAAFSLGGLFVLFERPGPLDGEAVLVIPKGESMAEIARLLERRQVISSATVFKAGVVLTGNQRRLRAGEYAFTGGISARGAMEVLVSGLTVVRKLTVPEGATTAEALQLVMAADGLKGDLGRTPGEGALLPDTYHYEHGDSRAGMIARMEEAMRETLARLWPNRAEGLPLKTPRDAVILASIVERETALPKERPLVAAVFHNRLARGMLLQSDPTVAYGIALREGIADLKLGRPLTQADLKTPGEFNTYLNPGLPPHPIANPGRAAIKAVLNPSRSKALYFVADGSGGHVFARTLAEHNHNVRRWRRLRDTRDGGGSPDAAP